MQLSELSLVFLPSPLLLWMVALGPVRDCASLKRFMQVHEGCVNPASYMCVEVGVNPAEPRRSEPALSLYTRCLRIHCFEY